jgi:NADH:ubiquinone oxidoreductase subunit 5 (subunit L)/multisubunit Na+/H+ antiporter MnhA subunit
VQAGKAATKAFLINKVGDLFLLTGISLFALSFHTLNFSSIAAVSALYPSDIIETIGAFLFLGAVGKSAQVGLHTWLPDAMEGPTPVSALIHAATMVTAGVFLLIRSSFVFEYAPRTLFLVAV